MNTIYDEMSLYIGNLSERTRRDELERVFRRFGDCNVRLKSEGYGFVVFDFPRDATKALRALKGRNICGEPLALTWSNKQPAGSSQRFSRGGGKIYEPRRARDSERLGYARRKEGSNGWRNDHKMGNDRRGESVDMAGEERGYRRDDFKDYVGEEKDYRGEFRDDGGRVVPSLEENGRWGELIPEPAVDSGNENDRYEPYHDYDRKHDDDNRHVVYSGGSPTTNSRENLGRTRIGGETSNRRMDSKFHRTCYKCGEPGHKMRDCPKEHSSRRKYNGLDGGRSNQIDRNHRVEDEDKFISDSLLRQRSSGDKVSASRQYHAPLRNNLSPIAKENDSHRRREHGGKKRSRNEIESPKRSKVKIPRHSISSTRTSNDCSSRSLRNSQSPKSLRVSSLHSRSRSASSRACSSSSKLRSSSKSPYRTQKSLNSMRSSSPASLSVSLNQPLLSSPKKIQFNSKSSSVNRDHLVTQGQHIGSAMELENLQPKDGGIVVNGISAVCTTAVNAVEKDQYVQENNNGNCSLLNPSDGVTYSSKPRVDVNLPSEVVKETGGSRHSGTLIIDDIPTEIQKQASETHVNPHSGLSTTISAEEMCMVLKNYGLELPKDDEKNLTVDAFFGSARLWPWHIVYYRRLKKGLISTENYARRVAQNQEFGIVDKYIRSSSGWGESNLEDSSTNDPPLVHLSS